MTLGEYLKSGRKAKQLTLQQVGDAIGVSKGHLHGIEAGRYVDIRLATAAALAQVLGLDIQILADLSLQVHDDAQCAAPEISDAPTGMS